MPVLYFDNFRGFARTFLSLKEVNFFIGENSTGKTSLLKLIGIISSPGFWRYQEFGKNETSFGGFSDIVTIDSSNKEYFEVGILDEESTNLSTINCVLLKFISENNFPKLKEIRFVDETMNLQAYVEGTSLKYRFNGVVPPVKDRAFFETWVTTNELNGAPFNKISLEAAGIIPTLSQLRTMVLNSGKQEALDENAIKLLNLSAPTFLRNLAWIAPVRAEPQKVYYTSGLIFNSEGKHSPSVLKEILLGEGVKKILNRFGNDSGLFDDMSIKELSNISEDAFEVLVFLNGSPRNITSVGYGVSQILPLIIEVIARPEKNLFAIQQPEIHLHPRAQAAFGDFVYKSNEKDFQRFIIETHSDFTIDRFRLRLSRKFREDDCKDVTPSNSQVVFFSRHAMGNKLEVIEINSDGSYPDLQPEEFRDFFIKEQFELITI